MEIVMAKIKIRDVFVKLSYLFPHDLYIINGVYVVGGDESESDTSTYNICILEADVVDLIRSEFPSEENGDSIIFIPSIKDIKDTIEGNYRWIRDKKKKADILEKFNFLHDICFDVNGWRPLSEYLPENALDIMYRKGSEVPIEVQGNQIHLSKKLFPIITDKTIGDVHIGISEEYSTDEYRRMVVNYPFTMFQMYLIVTFLPV